MMHSFILITSKLETRKHLLRLTQFYKIKSHIITTWKNKNPYSFNKTKNLSHKKKKPKIYVFGRISRIPYDPTRSYYFYDPSAILNVWMRWDRKIVRFYNPDRDFDNHDCSLDSRGGLVINLRLHHNTVFPLYVCVTAIHLNVTF